MKAISDEFFPRQRSKLHCRSKHRYLSLATVTATLRQNSDRWVGIVPIERIPSGNSPTRSHGLSPFRGLGGFVVRMIQMIILGKCMLDGQQDVSVEAVNSGSRGG
jgi:hypothetical protein